MNKNQPFKDLLKNPNFMKLWVSQVLSQMSINLMNFYVVTRIFSLTSSSTAVSLMWIAGALPCLLFAPFSGPVVDGVSKRKSMIVTNLLQAASISLLFFVSKAFSFYSVVFLYWFFDQIYMPSQQAAIPQLVDKKLLPAANGLFLLTQQASLLVGFGLGGLLITTLGNNITIAFATLNLIIAAIAVFLLPHDAPRTDIRDKNLLKFWKDLSVGYKFVKDHRAVMLPLLLIVCAQVFISITTVILPTYTHSVLHMEFSRAAVMLIVPGSMGALVMTYFLPRLLKRYRKKILIQTGLGIGGGVLLLLSVIKWFPFGQLLIAILAAIGLGGAIAAITVPAQTLVQEKTPAWIRGRVYSQLSFLMIMATAVPLFIVASLADALGVVTIMATFGILLLGVYLFIKKKGDYVLANGFGV